MAYINREKFAEKIAKCSAFNRQGFEFEGNLLQGVVLDLIDAEPTADVEEVKHGKWIYNTDDFTPKMRCSVCGYNKPLVAGENIEQDPNDYCNKCGAKMDGGKAE